METVDEDVAVAVRFVTTDIAPAGTTEVVAEDATLNADVPEAFTASISYEYVVFAQQFRSL